ncbi:MAG: hypothetical protein ACO2OY_02055 [Thermodesulfobacteriaceae bacterium]|jgi:hypothetical protein
MLFWEAKVSALIVTTPNRESMGPMSKTDVTSSARKFMPEDVLSAADVLREFAL